VQPWAYTNWRRLLWERAQFHLSCSMTPQLVSCKSLVDSRDYTEEPVMPAPCVGRAGEEDRPTSTRRPLPPALHIYVYKTNITVLLMGSENWVLTGFITTGIGHCISVMLGVSQVRILAIIPATPLEVDFLLLLRRLPSQYLQMNCEHIFPNSFNPSTQPYIWRYLICVRKTSS
jgi:hypothetical protein